MRKAAGLIFPHTAPLYGVQSEYTRECINMRYAPRGKC